MALLDGRLDEPHPWDRRRGRPSSSGTARLSLTARSLAGALHASRTDSSRVPVRPAHAADPRLVFLPGPHRFCALATGVVARHAFAGCALARTGHGGAHVAAAHQGTVRRLRRRRKPERRRRGQGRNRTLSRSGDSERRPEPGRVPALRRRTRPGPLRPRQGQRFETGRHEHRRRAGSGDGLDSAVVCPARRAAERRQSDRRRRAQVRAARRRAGVDRAATDAQ